MITRQYRTVNNLGGWFVFLIALATYWLTLEPTASYWDCGEFIIQGQKLEVGHPPGNPIFMLTARFFANFAPTPEKVSVMINAMSGLLSALTILILFWTITHLVRRLVVKDNRTEELSLQQYLIIMGSGMVGALAYCWSDTFWFSAVESEVYAFSSFCTALVFWLILKWENRADSPHSDRYLILIAYVIGVSLAVHLLNLLCIPAIVLVFVFRKYPDIKLSGSIMALLVSFVILFFVLYGLMPGFLKVAQITELIFVNGFHLGFNSGALAYAIIMVVSLLWAINSLYRQKSEWQIKVSFIVAVTLSGMLFVGSGVTIGIVLTVGLIALMFWGFRKTGVPVRILNVIIWSIAAIFIGFSSYALILIRSTANGPMNENAPDNVFTLASYLNREQYGETPLLYGPTLYSSAQRVNNNNFDVRVEKGGKIYAKGVHGADIYSGSDNFLSNAEVENNRRLDARGGDYYVLQGYKPEYVMNPELNMVFPRLYSKQHAGLYQEWVDFGDPNSLEYQRQMQNLTIYDPVTRENVDPAYVVMGYSDDGRAITAKDYLDYYGNSRAFKPSIKENLEYFFNYQLNHMYMRYFLWNFVGRQNDVLNQHGELDAGNWISGFSAYDNNRLGDQSLLPDYLGEENPGHNVYYFLPLILGIIGLIWQVFAGRRGIEQFWVVFFLFFMTGIAIVLYLNQYPGQPRERDYAFAGSFYAFTIWIGMGVAGIWRLFKPSVPAALIAVAIGLCIPLQMVSQTWDDHDRSGRYAARDFAINYLESLEPNAIIFCNGDNDTFPLWYAQEVEGVRPDVRIINLSYLNSDWYANQHRIQSYDAAPAPFTSTPQDIAYGKMDIARVPSGDVQADLLQSLKALYASKGIDPEIGYPMLSGNVLTIPLDKELMLKRGLVSPQDTAYMENAIYIDLRGGKGYLTLGETLMLDIIATNAAEGWPRPIYWASTVGHEYHLGLTPYLRSTGMAYQLTPVYSDYESLKPRTDIAYKNITEKYRWGWREGEKNPYYDETARRMLYGMRNSVLDLADMLYFEGQMLMEEGEVVKAKETFHKTLDLLGLLEKNLNENVSYYDLGNAQQLGRLYCALGQELGDKKATERGMEILEQQLNKYAKALKYNKWARQYGTTTYDIIRLPFDYDRLVDTYLKYGGKTSYVENLLKPQGWSMKELRDYADMLYKRMTGTGSDNSVSQEEEYSEEDHLQMLQEMALEIVQMCENANRLKALDPEAYAQEDPEILMRDSILDYYINYYLEIGGTEESLKSHEDYNKLDRARAKSLSDRFVANHPELLR